MALVTGSANAGLDTARSIFAPNFSAEAGEALNAVAPCYLHTDGKLYRSLAVTGTSAGAAIAGFTPRQYNNGEMATVYGEGAVFEYKDSGLTIGAVYYMSALSAGMLESAATNGDNAGVAQAIDAQRIRVIRADGRKVGK